MESTSHRTISLILLAAGSSSRMGQPKQLLLVDGEPLLLRTVKASLASVAGNVIVVLGDHEKEIRSTLEHLPIHTVVNKEWNKGIGSSIKTALQYALNSQQDLQAAVIVVCDQPSLTSSHLDAIINTYHRTQKPIIASHYLNTDGVPALFDKTIFSELLNINDDHGAKILFKKYPERLATVEFPGGEIDLDTWEQYQEFKTNSNIGDKKGH